MPGDFALPVELRSRFDPIWRDPDRLLAVFSPYVDEADVRLLRVNPQTSGLVHSRVVARWAVHNGFASADHPAFPDWHRLRAAGLNG